MKYPHGLLSVTLAIVLNWHPLSVSEQIDNQSNQALALPFLSVPDYGGYRESPKVRRYFWREYAWLKKMLEDQYPGNEFMILPVDDYNKTPPGWTWIPFVWRRHLIYRKPLAARFA